MAFPTDLEIARRASLKPLDDIASEIGLGSHLLEPYGEEVMKIKLAAIDELASTPKAKYVVVTAITPTPLGEGKTTIVFHGGATLQGTVTANEKGKTFLSYTDYTGNANVDAKGGVNVTLIPEIELQPPPVSWPEPEQFLEPEED